MTGAGKREKEQWTEREREIDRLGRKMERETERVRENVRLDFVAQIDEAE